jgi:succinate-semialdehyde dehydrogenase/glutarate-semialdehyde dehydrogenase
VFSVVTGDPKAIGGELTSNPIVRKLSFTGSTPVGRLLMRNARRRSRRCRWNWAATRRSSCSTMPISTAVQGAIASKYRNSGQTCVCANRFYVQEGVYDAFAQLAAAVGQLKVGRGTEPGVTQGR